LLVNALLAAASLRLRESADRRFFFFAPMRKGSGIPAFAGMTGGARLA
jgi:hypothetical protein